MRHPRAAFCASERAVSHRSAVLVLVLSFSSWWLPTYCVCQKTEPDLPMGKSQQTEGGPSSPNRREDSLRSPSPALPAEARNDELRVRLLADHGAILVARGGATPPPSIIFSDQTEVERWQSSVRSGRVEIATIAIELQEPALQAFLKAHTEARKLRLAITPRSRDAARRSYADTVALWQSRVDPGLKYWVRKRRITPAEANRIRALPPMEQVPEILRLERDRLFFSKDLSKSILYSVAAPGTSQHLAMLALDINEHANKKVRSILAGQGWFQTIPRDLPHFTYLGSREEQLPSLGLRKVTWVDRTFWVPDMDSPAARTSHLH
jgi:hypothetical protein